MKGIVNVVQGRDQWLVLVKGIMNVAQGKNQCRVLLKKTNPWLGCDENNFCHSM